MKDAEPGRDRVVFSVVVSKGLADRLTRLAESRGAKRAQLCRVLLADGVERQERIQRVAQALDQAEPVAV